MIITKPGPAQHIPANAPPVFVLSPGSPIPQWQPPQPPYQLVGVKSPYLVHTEAKNTNPLTSGTPFVTITFDTTSRTDAARILLKNNSADNMIITSAGIFGQKVHQQSGTSGFIHDKYVNYESIAIDGDRLLQVGNNMVCTVAQVNQLADILWKRNKVKRHIYTVTLPGSLTYFEPGEWYTLTLGSAGTQENINSLCECYSIRMSHSVSDVGTTQIAFREVLQNWTFDSNENARFVAAGGFNRKPTGKVLTVASFTYVGSADFYCDGTADEVEINNAMSLLSYQGGGTVQLTEGTFTVAAAIDVLSNIRLAGSGNATIIATNSSVYTIQSVGTVGARRSNCIICNMQLISPNEVYCEYSDSLVIDNVTITGTLAGITPHFGMIWIDTDCNDAHVTNCHIDGGGNANTTLVYGIDMNGCPRSIIMGNSVKGLRSGSGAGLVAIQAAGGATSQIISNSIFDISMSGTITYGIAALGAYSIISNNRVEQVKNTGTATHVAAISAAGTSISVIGNYCYNNGSDTGIANTNGNNFSDSGTDTQYAG